MEYDAEFEDEDGGELRGVGFWDETVLHLFFFLAPVVGNIFVVDVVTSMAEMIVTWDVRGCWTVRVA